MFVQFCLISRANVVLESLKSRIGRSCLLQHFREKPAHTPETPHVQPLSCKHECTNQKHFNCFLLKPVRNNLAPGFLRGRDLSPLHAQKSSGSRLQRGLILRSDTPLNKPCDVIKQL